MGRGASLPIARQAGLLILSAIQDSLNKLRFRLFGRPAPMASEDRTFLEETIFPWLASRSDLSRILFTGTRIYTAHYPRYFPRHLFYTIDLDRVNRPWGSPGRHVTGDVTELEKHYPPGFFDCVILNGLIGFGVDEKAQVEKMLAQASIVLKPGGMLIIGWNDVSDRTPFDFDRLEGLGLFEPYAPGILPAGGHRHQTMSRMRHVFDFHTKHE